jgi:hypothetical protein
VNSTDQIKAQPQNISSGAASDPAPNACRRKLLRLDTPRGHPVETQEPHRDRCLLLGTQDGCIYADHGTLTHYELRAGGASCTCTQQQAQYQKQELSNRSRPLCCKQARNPPGTMNIQEWSFMIKPGEPHVVKILLQTIVLRNTPDYIFAIASRQVAAPAYATYLQV